MPTKRRKTKKIAKVQPRIQSVIQDDEKTSSWRIFKIMGEFVSGFEFLKQYDAAVTIFGSARFSEDTKAYQEATALTEELSKLGFAVITGGGPGIMEAANRGAHNAKGVSVGLNIQLPKEQRINRFVEDSLAFHYFFTRKVMLSYASEIYIFFPGGFGTLDELFEMLTLVQTRKVCNVPIILVGRAFWEPLLKWIERYMYKKHHAIDERDMQLYTLVDTADEALREVKKAIKSGTLGKQECPVEYHEGQDIER